MNPSARAASPSTDVPPRRHDIAGVSNFRDFGGYRTARGTMLAAGRLYRSAHLAGLTPDGGSGLAGLGIATVVDLRGAGERARAGAACLDDHGIAVVSAPVEPRATRNVRERLAQGLIGRTEMRELMIDTYRSFVADDAPAFGAAIVAMLEAHRRPLLVHCTAGKDRTGFVVALVHALLGVPRDRIVADYAATNETWDRASVGDLLRFDADAIEPLLAADPDYLDAAFAAIARIDGSVEGFLDRATAGRVPPDHFNAWISEG